MVTEIVTAGDAAAGAGAPVVAPVEEDDDGSVEGTTTGPPLPHPGDPPVTGSWDAEGSGRISLDKDIV